MIISDARHLSALTAHHGVKAEGVHNRLEQVETDALNQKKKLRELKKRNDIATCLCFIITVIALIAAAILFAYRIM